MNDTKLIKNDADEAKKLLENQFFQVQIWGVLRKAIENRLLAYDLSEGPEKAQDIIRYRQLLEEFETIAKLAVRRGREIEIKELKSLEKENKANKIREFKR